MESSQELDEESLWLTLMPPASMCTQEASTLEWTADFTFFIIPTLEVLYF